MLSDIVRGFSRMDRKDGFANEKSPTVESARAGLIPVL